MIATTGDTIEGDTVEQIKGDAGVSSSGDDVVYHLAVAPSHQQQSSHRSALFQHSKDRAPPVDDLFFVGFAHALGRQEGKGE